MDVTVTLPPTAVPADWAAAIDAEAARRGETPTEFRRQAILARLPASVRAKLSTPRPHGRPRKASS